MSRHPLRSATAHRPIAIVLALLVLLVPVGFGAQLSTASGTATTVKETATSVPREWSHWEVLERLPVGFIGQRVSGRLVVGHVGKDESQRAAVWSEPNGLQIIGAPGSDAVDVNALGDVLVAQDQANFVWNGGSVRQLGNAGAETHATAINADGIVAGWTRLSTEPGAGVEILRWVGVTPEVLFTTRSVGYASAINDTGVIAGVNGFPGEDPTGFRWYPDRPTQIQTLPGMLSTSDINAAGDVVGRNLSQPVLAVAGSARVQIIVSAGESGGGAYRVNAQRDILGSDSRGHAVWPRGGVPVRLPTVIEDQYVFDWHDLTDSREFLVVSHPNVDQPPPNSEQTLLVRPTPPGAVFDRLAVQNADLPSYDWVDTPARGVYEGTPTRIAATLRNPTDKPHLVEYEVLDHATGQRVEGGWVADGLDPGEVTKVSVEIDPGSAWVGDQPRPAPSYDVVLSADGMEWDRQQVDVPVRPRPLVLVHGFNADASTWAGYHNIIRTRHPRWDAFAVGDGQASGAMHTGTLLDPLIPADSLVSNANVLAAYIREIRNHFDVEQIDLVAHSMGGLISRQYVHADMLQTSTGEPVAKHLVMLGTPNHGSPCADIMPLASMWELRPDVLERFNQRVVDRKGVAMSVMAGAIMPRTCLDDVIGDGVVPIASALGGWTDTAIAVRLHTDMTGPEDFEGFVFPHLVGGAAAALSTEGSEAQDTADVPDNRTVLETERLELGADETKQLDVAVAGASTVGAVAPIPPHWSLELISSDGDVVASATNDVGAPITAVSTPPDLPVHSGTWHVRITSDDQAAVTMVSTVAVDSTIKVEATSTHEAGLVTTRARLVANGATVPAADGEATFAATSGGSWTFPFRQAADGELVLEALDLPDGDYVVTTRLSGEDLSAVDIGTVTVSSPVDDVAPSVDATVEPVPAGDWRNAPADVVITATDDGSGVEEISWTSTGAQHDGNIVPGDRVTVPVTVEGLTEVAAHAMDRAGNLSKQVAATVRLDLTKPAVRVGVPAQGQRVPVGADLRAEYECLDALAGIDACTGSGKPGDPLPTSVPGDHTFQVVARDRAGNQTTSTVHYQVEAAAKPPLEKATPVVKAAARALGNRKARLAITVAVPGLNPATGTVTIKRRGKVLGRPAALRGGRVMFTLRKQPKGNVTYLVVYSGDPGIAPRTIKVSVRIR